MSGIGHLVFFSKILLQTSFLCTVLSLCVLLILRHTNFILIQRCVSLEQPSELLGSKSGSLE